MYPRAAKPSPTKAKVDGSGAAEPESAVNVLSNKLLNEMIDVLPLFPVTVRMLPMLTVLGCPVSGQTLKVKAVETLQLTGEMIACADDSLLPRLLWDSEAVRLL